MILPLKVTIAAAVVLFSTMSVAGQCVSLTGTYTDTASSSVVQYITSYNYPSYYSNYIDCTSTISPVGSGQILFYVELEDIEYSYDFLKIYSGSVQLYHSDQNSAPFVDLTTAGEDLTVRFTTDYSVALGGYKLNFIEVDFQGQASCGSTLTATASQQQLSYVHTSSQPTPCTWTINAADSLSYVTIEVLLVQGYVKITEAGHESYLYTTSYSYVSGQYDASVQVIGLSGVDFVVQFISSSVGGTGAVTPATGTASDTSICSNTYRTSYNTKQYVNSPNYPSLYPNSRTCSVVLEADDTYKSVTVEIIDYALAIFDTLTIYDGNSAYYNPFSGVSTGSVFTSSGASLTVVFDTNSYGQDRGFNLTYNSVVREIPTCDSVVLDENVTSSSTEHTIESPNYPSDYYNNIDRYWLIVKPVESDNIVLDFRVFQVEESADCIYDYVTIYDGACTSDPVIAEFCGYDPVTIEEPTGLYILVHFHTDGSVVKKGWSLTHYIGQYQDPDADDDDDGVVIKDFIYPVIGIVVILVLAGIIFTIFYCKTKGRVGAGEAKPAPKRRTTHELMTELSNRYYLTETEKQPKVKRKAQIYHPEPNPPGPNVNIINRGQLPPHPPPVLSDPAYPPDFMSTGSQMPPQNIAPVLAPGSSVAPSASPIPPGSAPSMIPQPFAYLTPSEARAQGLYGSS
ncbi:deleted in malignant brain tumors 1 protein-like [Mercenaria mercenaria]|uniref:deleted in malignant brain tumors 1 protein-like n=1 Tax=Mercenaria mercenaria TaxID=6596 RepID=UPI00234F2248|nr:deleted in malignant brain tumors 1 protein-like [Mercenaria mercenaria]